MPDRSSDDEFGAGSLADVVGLRVGHHQRTTRGWATGTTVVFAPTSMVVGVDVRGGGPGTRETEALDPRNLVDRIHAICLTGGSAYGLAAADGVMNALEHRHLGVAVGTKPDHVVPVVPTAVIFDLGRGGAFGNRPTAEFGTAALEQAADQTRPPRRGSVGAGTGARAGGLQGGVGMASAKITIDDQVVTVAALAVVNASGQLVDPATGLPWGGWRGLRRRSAAERAALTAALGPSTSSEIPLNTIPLNTMPLNTMPLNTTVGVVATDARLERPETSRMAMSAHDGLARAIRPAHALTDGDTIFGASTGTLELPSVSSGLAPRGASRTVALNRIFAAAADVFAAACVDAVVTARRVGQGPAYRDLFPSAYIAH